MPALRIFAIATLAAGLAGAARAAAPDVQAVQQAYDTAKLEPEAARQHVYELQITNAKCSLPAGEKAQVCQIDFVRRDEPRGRLYFDVITMQEAQGRWLLLSGLCKSRPPLR